MSASTASAAARPVLTTLETKLQKESRQIRLARILSNPTKRHGIELELFLTSLNDVTDYIALSYTWGSAELDPQTGKEYPSDNFEIDYNGGTIELTENLFDFL